MRKLQRTGRALLGAALVAVGLGGCDLITPIEQNPNQVPVATLDQLFTSIQVNAFFQNEGQVARLAAVWLNQMAGTDRQFSILDQYIINESTADGEFNAMYTEGGLVALRSAKNLAVEAGCSVCHGILQVYEAYLIGMTADVWGDIPYTEAALPDIENPVLDPQLQVYAMLQDTLSAAIQNLETGAVGGATGFGDSDLIFGGDPEPWIEIAHSLKARYFLHLTEVDASAYENALAEAQQGISTPANNFRSIHTQVATEANIWNQFTRDRSGYISGGYYLIHLMNGGTPDVFADDDPRLPLYFVETNGLAPEFGPAFIGSPPGNPAGDPGQNASQLRRDPGFPGGADYNQPILTCSETQFIIAESALRTGDRATALAAYEAGLACEEAYWGVQLVDNPNVTNLNEVAALDDDALLREIIEQKYIANFLNYEVYNDYRRLCLPIPGTFNGLPIPGRLFYSGQERQTNANVPDPAQQPQVVTSFAPNYPCNLGAFPFPLP
jgi:hypothetical protein